MAEYSSDEDDYFSLPKADPHKFKIEGRCGQMERWGRDHYSHIAVLLEDKAIAFHVRDADRKREFLKTYKPAPFDGWKLREMYPDYIPVSVEEHPRTDDPELSRNKYYVHQDMPLGEFLVDIRRDVGRQISVSFKNTKPPTGALMSVIDAENKDDDGFLRITYRGKGKGKSHNSKRKQLSREELVKEVKKLKKKGECITLYPIMELDPSNYSARDLFRAGRTIYPGREHLLEVTEESDTVIDPWKLRKGIPDHIPVRVVKDPSSDLREIGSKVYLVFGDMPFEEFVEFIQGEVLLPVANPVSVYFKNGKPPPDALMSEIDKKNENEDGFLVATYSGMMKSEKASKKWWK